MSPALAPPLCSRKRAASTCERAAECQGLMPMRTRNDSAGPALGTKSETQNHQYENRPELFVPASCSRTCLATKQPRRTIKHAVQILIVIASPRNFFATSSPPSTDLAIVLYDSSRSTQYKSARLYARFFSTSNAE
eukprot:CAMPEP_0113230984 /NCGR_PEP_ID=MMETSP0008_2-20120614/1184_1 /TAXON_ID=97485 /ORGANISM="Prymnesium parvum" /LENGTH=135 /DNA_ID=CAMNT_0000077621 /DNA_START=371 /DNA_END=778 /DNA_ORIENTATION=- /assembly_acc=CAM_ASM_000153